MKSLYLFLIILLALALRIPGAFWGQIDFPVYEVWEPDEFQHASIAAEQVHLIDTTYFKKRDFSKNWNARAFGKQSGVLAYFGKQLGIFELKEGKLVFLGRFLSTFYSILLILLIYRWTKIISKDSRTALFAAFLLAVFDLNVTYSHYSLPAISYVFWAYFSLFFIFKYHQKIKRLSLHSDFLFIVFLPLPFAMIFATKLDFIPLAIFGLFITILFTQRTIKSLHYFSLGIWLLVGSCCYYYLAHGFEWTFEEAKRSFIVAKDLNENVIPKDQHWLHNPLLYLAAIIGGTSFPVFLIAFATASFLLKKALQKKLKKEHLLLVFIFVLFLCLEFLVRWRMDTAFVRRANIFLPACAMLAAYGLQKILVEGIFKNRMIAYLMIAFIFCYTLGITIVSQSNFWKDNRYKAASYLLSEHLLEDQKRHYSMYVNTKNMPKANTVSFEKASILVLHEAYYSRYWKSFTTPFKLPNCCEEVYHCHGKTVCQFYQDVLSNKTDFQLIKSFPLRTLFPERILYQHYFGSYETFLGTVKIYKR